MVLDRFRAAVAVYGIVRDGDRVLLMRRAGSGYHDGELSLPAGHIDGGEDVRTALVRELAEELTITVDPIDCRLCVVAHRAPETAADVEYMDLFFTVDRWSGTPTIGEPGKCTELRWSTPDELPPDVIGYVSRALVADAGDERLLLEGWSARGTADSP
jgi:8-oxo-dGTP pyrophosphatase MutT (NUDIX family)